MAATAAKTGASKKRTKYQGLVKAKSAYCKGKATKAQVRKAAGSYVADAVKKAVKAGKTATEARKEYLAKANKVLNSACAMTAKVPSVSGTKRKRGRPKVKK